MKEEFLSFIKKHRLIRPEERVLVAFSGGADSTCLLHLLVETGNDVAAAHLHHSQRPEGDSDVDHCRELCNRLGIPFFAGKADVPGVAKAHKIGIEEAGRKLRYEFFQMIAAQGFQKIATGHTQDDNLESMILHLARGTGMRGLAGIPVQRGQVVRPILTFSREQTHAYCKDNGLPFVSDSYNDDQSYARNLVRNQVVAPLRKVNPEVAEHAFATARILSEENDLLDSLAASHLQAAERPPKHAAAFIEVFVTATWSNLGHLPVPLIRRCVRLAAQLYGGSLDLGQTQAIAEAMHMKRKVSFTAEGGEVAVKVDETAWRVVRSETVAPFREMLTLNGEIIADDLGWSLAAWHGKAETGPLVASVDAAKLKGDLFARSIKTGDKVNPQGRGDQKSLIERLSRAGVPQAVRDRLPVVCDLIGPVWAPIVGVDRRCSVDAATTEFLALRLSAIEAAAGTAGAV